MNADFAQALIDAQAEMPGIEPDAVNPHFRSKFVSLDHLLAKTLPVLNKNGIGVTQFPTQNEQGFPTLTTVLFHGLTGDSLSYEMPLILVKQDPQGQGSAITYARRYALAAALGISSEKDDDAESATRTAGGAEEPKPPRDPNPTGAAPRPAPDPPPAAETAEEALARLKTWWNEQDGRGLPAKIAKVDDADRLRLLLEIESERQLEGKPQRKTIQVALSSRIRELEPDLEGEPPATDAPAETMLSPEAAQDGPVTAPASPSETEPGEDGLDTRSTSPGSTNGEVLRLKAALGWIQDQPSSVDNPQLWTVKDVLWALSQRGGGTFGLIEEIPPEWLEAIWVAIPEGVRSSVEMLGPEAKAALAAKAT